MFEFQWPWLLLLLPLPLLVRYFAPAVQSSGRSALRVPFIAQLEQAAGHTGSPRLNSSRMLLVLALLTWISLLLAAARPQWLGEPTAITLQGRDLLLAVDLSESMLEQDFILNNQVVNRLSATKAVASDFIERRDGDRLGLILFGDEVHLQAPLTHDRQTVKQLLLEAQIGLAGKKTAIGDALALAVKRFKALNSQQRILILLTDGSNTAGVLSPVRAARLAKEEGVKVYTIGIGQEGFWGRSDLDERTLTQIARITGGQYFRARNLEELARIYGLLDELEPVEQDNDYYRPVTSLFQWPLMLALLCWAGVLLLRQRIN